MTIQHIETKGNLDEETLRSVQYLLQANLDAAEGFDEAAAAVQDAELTDRFGAWARERERSAEELRRYIALNAEQPESEGTWAAEYRRAWMAIKAAITAGNAQTVLKDVQRGEEQLRWKYEEALATAPGAAMNDVLQRQHRQITYAIDELGELQAERTRRLG